MQTRRLLGDVNIAAQLITDEELNYLLTSEGDPVRAALQACYDLAAQFSPDVDYDLPQDIAEKASQRAAAFLTLAKELERRLARKAPPYGGGIDKSDIEARRSDTSIVQPGFTRDMDEEPVWADAEIPVTPIQLPI